MLELWEWPVVTPFLFLHSQLKGIHHKFEGSLELISPLPGFPNCINADH